MAVYDKSGITAVRANIERLTQMIKGHTGKEILIVKQDRWELSTHNALSWTSTSDIWAVPIAPSWTYSQSIEYGVLSGDALLDALPPYTARIPTAFTRYYSNNDPFWRTIRQDIVLRSEHLLALGEHVPLLSSGSKHGLQVYIGDGLERDVQVYALHQALKEARAYKP